MAMWKISLVKLFGKENIHMRTGEFRDSRFVAIGRRCCRRIAKPSIVEYQKDWAVKKNEYQRTALHQGAK